MLSGMTFDEHVRKRLKDTMEAKGVTQAALGKALDLSQQAVDAYLREKVKNWTPDRVRKAEEYLGERLMPDDLPGLSSRPKDVGYVHPKGYRRTAPVIAIRRAPPGVEATRMAEIIRGLTTEKDGHGTNSDDPGAFGLRLTEPRDIVDEEFRLGDILIASPGELGQLEHLDWIIIEVSSDVRVARYKVLKSGATIAEIHNEDVGEYRPLGRVVELFRDLRRKQ